MRIEWGYNFFPPKELLRDHPGGSCCMQWNGTSWELVAAESNIKAGYRAPTSDEIKAEMGRPGRFDKECILADCRRITGA